MSEKYFYARVDENGVCRGVSSLSGPVATDDLIAIKKYDPSMIGAKRWSGGSWVNHTDPPLRKISRRMFMSRLGQDELGVLVTDPKAATLLKLLSVVDEVDLDSPLVQQAVASLPLAEARKAELLRRQPISSDH